MLPDVCNALELGSIAQVKKIETGSHHLVWKATTTRGTFALRASAKIAGGGRSQRERLWETVGKWAVAPAYRDCYRVRLDRFDGWIEAFDWIEGRRLRPSADHIDLAQTLARLHLHPISSRFALVPRVDIVSFLKKRLANDLRAISGRSQIEKLLQNRTLQSLSLLRTRSPSHSKPCLIHNDLVDGNVIHSTERLALIDWDWAMITQPEVDLFCFLSPFVRSWRSTPRYVRPQTAVEFLDEYIRRVRRGKGQKPRIESELWKPYNTLLANWLRQAPLAPPHANSRSFYVKAFQEIDELAPILASFK